MSSELIAHFLRSVPIDDVMAYIAQICTYDRYQASRGIEEAASLVADTARAIGLADVSIEHFPADGTTQWWSFRAPVSWTPTAARLEIRCNDCCLLEVDHVQQPFSVATYSAATPRGGVTARLVNVLDSKPGLNLAGAVAVVGRSQFARSDLLPELISGGAIGFVTDAACCDTWPELEHLGRIELIPTATLFGFSVTSRQLEFIRTWANQEANAHVVVDIDRAASMPIVTGVLPGDRVDEEVWLIAHLCHPRPGANDNASGVAALLGVAAAHIASRQADASWSTGRTIRFLWGPEFLGTAAMLHGRMDRLGRASLPSAVIDFDMVGEDQSLCGCPFIVERNPDFRPSLISPIAEHVVSQVFAHTSTHHGVWQSVPFTGFSDHALFADPNVGCAAVQFCHAPDRFNHTSGDSLDKVSIVEMLRATAAGAALSHIMANDGALSRFLIERIVRDWCAEEHQAARRTARHYRHFDGGDWGRRLVRYIDQRNAAMLSLLSCTAGFPIGGMKDWPAGLPEEPAVLGRWSGPINVRALIADLPTGSQSAVSDLIRADKHNYSLLLNFAIRADGHRSQNEVINETSFALQRPINNGIARRLFGALIESGWVMEVTKDAGSNQ